MERNFVLTLNKPFHALLIWGLFCKARQMHSPTSILSHNDVKKLQ